jgi:hypothetical protein
MSAATQCVLPHDTSYANHVTQELLSRCCRHQGKAIDRFGVEWEKAALYFGDVFHTLLNVSPAGCRCLLFTTAENCTQLPAGKAKLHVTLLFCLAGSECRQT